MNTNFIQLINLTHKVGTNTLLKNVNCSIKKSDFVAIIGPNGIGKSSLLRILCNLAKPIHGQALLTQDCKLGYAPDLPPLYPHDTVTSYLRFIARLKKVTKSRVEECIGILDLAAIKNAQIYTLSKGMQQRVNLAQAILNEPELLILDEPTNGLDEEHSAQFCDYLKSLQDTTIIMASHQYSDFIMHCDYMLKIQNQKLEKILSPQSNIIKEVSHDQCHHTT